MNSTANLVQEVERLTQALADSNLALMQAQEVAQAANRQAEEAKAANAVPFAFVIINEQGGVEFATNTHDEAQTHINDAISEHDIEGAGKWRSIPAHEMRPSDDKLWDQTIRERDYNAEIADKLADAIAEYFGADIGEHSSANCPWLSALTVIEEAAPQQHAQPSALMVFDGDSTDQPVVEATAERLLKSRQMYPKNEQAAQPAKQYGLAAYAQANADSRVTGNAQAALSDEQSQNLELVIDRLEQIAAHPIRHIDTKELAEQALPCARAILATRQPAPVSFSHGAQERLYIGQRLRELSVMAGNEAHGDDEFYYRHAFNILNGVSREFEKRAAPVASAPAVAVPVDWTPGPNEFKDWCTQYFGPDADDTHLAEAVFNLPRMAQRFANSVAPSYFGQALHLLGEVMRPYGIYDTAVNHAGGLQSDFIEVGKQVREVISAPQPAAAPVAAAVQGEQTDPMDYIDPDYVFSLADTHADETLESGQRIIDRGGILQIVVDALRHYAQRAASQPTPVRTYDWSREGMELADGQSGAYVRHFDFVMKNASQDTVPTTVANQAINDALRVGMQDSERDAAIHKALDYLLAGIPMSAQITLQSAVNAMAAQQSEKR